MVAALIFLPPFIMIFSIIFFKAGGDFCLFDPNFNGSRARYLLQKIYPEPEETPVFIQVRHKGNTRIQIGDTVTWDNPVGLDGNYRESDDSPAYLTLFWVPTQYSGLSLFKKHWIRQLTGSAVIDVTGFLGPPGNVYAIAVKDKSGGFFFGKWDISKGDQTFFSEKALKRNPLLNEFDARENLLNQRKTIFFIGPENSFVGRATYDSSTGVLIRAISFTKSGLSLILSESDYPTNRLRRILLPYVLVIAVALAFYEMYWSSAQGSEKSEDLPVHVDFAIFGYTSVLVDLYLDLYFYQLAGNLILIGAHLFMVFLFLFRFGWWWAALPAMEMIFFLVVWLLIGNAHYVFTYFPASLGAWFLALMIEGKVSPGALPKLIENLASLDKLIRRKRTF
jgi:hypothetical protein